MRRLGFIGVFILGFFFQDFPARAESSLDALEQELNQVKQEHQDSNSQVFIGFIDELDKAVQSADDALLLYQDAGRRNAGLSRQS